MYLTNSLKDLGYIWYENYVTNKTENHKKLPEAIRDHPKIALNYPKSAEASPNSPENTHNSHQWCIANCII